MSCMEQHLQMADIMAVPYSHRPLPTGSFIRLSLLALFLRQEQLAAGLVNFIIVNKSLVKFIISELQLLN